jgi:Ca-activated chloride channel family protein
MLSRSVFENSRPGGISVLEIVNGRGPGEPRRFVPLKRTELKGEGSGPLAALRLIHTYGYTKEQCDAKLEAVYRFPLPGDAAVTAVSVRFGDVEIYTELKERRQAEEEYEEAREEGRQAALVTRESPDVFSLQLNGLEPDQDVVVETCFVVRARTAGPGWTLRVPLTTAPRYARSDEIDSRHAAGQPLALLRDPGHRFALDLKIAAADTALSGTHEIVTGEEGDCLRVTLGQGEIIPDRDFVLSWQPRVAEDRVGVELLLHDDPDDEYLYFMALVVPPGTHRRGTGVAREVILLLDRSGSMYGAKWEASDWAVKNFLSGLSERDTLAFARFHNVTNWLHTRPKKASGEVIEQALAFLEREDSGGTKLGVALEQALDLERTEGDLARHVLVITDVQVSDAGRLLRLAQEESRERERRRISVLCIDAAPNSFVATELAQRGGGVARFLTSDPEEEDIATALEEVMADWAEPVHAGLRLEVDRPGVRAAAHGESDAPDGWSAIDLGDLPAGRPRWVVGRLLRGEARELEVRLSASGERLASQSVRLPDEGVHRPALKALFGARRIAELEFLMESHGLVEDIREELARLGYDPDDILEGASTDRRKVYTENVAAEGRDALRSLLVREAMNFGLASGETAFVGVRTEKGQRVEGTVVVANALPADWSDDFLGGGLMAALAAPGSVPSAMPRGLGKMARSLFGESDESLDSVYYAMPPDTTARSRPRRVSPGRLAVFGGVPTFAGSEAILFESSKGEGPALPEEVRLGGVRVEFTGDTPEVDALDPELCLLVFVGDLASPRARVKLADLVRQGGIRPLNILRRAGDVVSVVLSDPSGAWANAAPAIEVSLHW